MSVFTYVIADETRSFRSKRPRFCQTRSVCRFSADNIAVSGLTEMLSSGDGIYTSEERLQVLGRYIAVSGLTEMLCRVEEIFSGKEWSGRRHERIHIRDCRRLALILPHEEIYSRESGDTKDPSEVRELGVINKSTPSSDGALNYAYSTQGIKVLGRGCGG